MEFSDLNTDRQLTPEELAELKRPNRDQLYPPLEDEAEDEERISNLMAIKGGLSEQSQEEDLDTLIEAPFETSIEIPDDGPKLKEIYKGVSDGMWFLFDFVTTDENMVLTDIERHKNNQIIECFFDIRAPYEKWSEEMKKHFREDANLRVYCEFDWDEAKFEIYLDDHNKPHKKPFQLATFDPEQRKFLVEFEDK